MRENSTKRKRLPKDEEEIARLKIVRREERSELERRKLALRNVGAPKGSQASTHQV